MAGEVGGELGSCVALLKDVHYCTEYGPPNDGCLGTVLEALEIYFC